MQIKKENELISYWSKILAERLVEIRFIDLDEMKAAITVHIKSALYDCLKVQISETKRNLYELKKEYAASTGSSKKIQLEIIALNEKLKEENMLHSALQSENKMKELTLWMRKHHEDSLMEFFKHADSIGL